MKSESRRVVLFGITVFWSALLLLLVQPVITKAILPRYGGSAGVWTTSMLFFQAVLLCGYFYAHQISLKLAPRTQVMVHGALLLLSLATLPLSPGKGWTPEAGANPVLSILGLLCTSVGLPYFLLSSTIPLLQSWFSRSQCVRLPWRLFAVSNLGSLIALLSYPVAIEPALRVRDQLSLWSAGYVVFAVLCLLAGWFSRSAPVGVAEISKRPALKDVLLWIALAATPSILWLATAAHLSQDVAPIPLLWVLPLAIYLLSFVLTFDSDRFYSRWVGWVGVPIALCSWGYALYYGNLSQLTTIISLFALALFIASMFCHGELARRKPDVEHLTSFYVCLSVGGAVGGLFVAIIAPLVFTEFFELALGIALLAVLALRLSYRIPAVVVAPLGVAVAAGAVYISIPNYRGTVRSSARNFYGTLHTVDRGEQEEKLRLMFNGGIVHGSQFQSPSRSRSRTTYYGDNSGVGTAVAELQKGGAPLRVGAIGLGAGTMAAYGRSEDYFRFYDINPDVIRLATSEFTFLRDGKAKYDIVTGDARLSLDRERPQNFDLIVVDAFTGDSIPVHLLTREAFDLYLRHLRPSGIIAVHISSKYVDLAPVVGAAAHDHGLQAFHIASPGDSRRDIALAEWVLVTRNPAAGEALGGSLRRLDENATLPVWTDDYSSVMAIIR